MTENQGKKENSINIIERGIAAGVVIICAGIFLSFVWNNNVWMDEAFTASLVNTDFVGVLYRSMMDTLPPLYNIYLFLMTSVFGYSITVMKISSTIPMILTLILGMTTVRRRFGMKTAVLFDMFITFMPLMLYYGVEIRMYSLGFFFATASGVYAYELVCDYNSKNLRFFVLFSVLAGYSHHFAFVTVGFVFLFLLLYYVFYERANVKRWVRALIYTIVFYLPCMVVTIKQFGNVSGYFSMPDVDLHMFIQYVLYPYIVGITPATLLCAAVALSAGCIALWKIVRGRKEEKMYAYALRCFTVYYGVLIFGTVISKIMTANIFVDRYLFFSTGLLWLCVSIVFGKADKKIYFPVIAATLCIGICSYIVMYRTEYSSSADEEIAVLRESVKEGDVFLGLGGHEELECCIPFYSMVDKKTPELKVVYSLTEGLTYLSENPGNSMFIGMMPDYDFTEEDKNLINNSDSSVQMISKFEFDRYVCDFYEVKKR